MRRALYLFLLLALPLLTQPVLAQDASKLPSGLQPVPEPPPPPPGYEPTQGLEPEVSTILISPSLKKVSFI